MRAWETHYPLLVNNKRSRHGEFPGRIAVKGGQVESELLLVDHASEQALDNVSLAKGWILQDSILSSILSRKNRPLRERYATGRCSITHVSTTTHGKLCRGAEAGLISPFLGGLMPLISFWIPEWPF
jgi:hypothetical protein